MFIILFPTSLMSPILFMWQDLKSSFPWIQRRPFSLICLMTSLIYEDYDNPPYSMPGPLIIYPTYRSPCNHKVILPNKLMNERYLLDKWIWTLLLDHFNDGWRRCIRASSWMILFQMKNPSSIRKGCSFWWGWFFPSLDDLVLGQGDDPCLFYNLEVDDNAFLPSFVV